MPRRKKTKETAAEVAPAVEKQEAAAAVEPEAEAQIETKEAVRTARVAQYLPCYFTDKELSARGQELARENSKIAAIEAEKKTANAQFNERLAQCKQTIQKLSREMNERYEMRNVACEVTFHKPASGRKTIVRLDTNELVIEQSMTSDELQDPLPFTALETVSESETQTTQ